MVGTSRHPEFKETKNSKASKYVCDRRAYFMQAIDSRLHLQMRHHRAMTGPRINSSLETTPNRWFLKNDTKIDF